MSIIIEQLFVLYTFLLLGWGFGKFKKDLTQHTKIISFLLVNLFLPAKVFNSFSKNFTKGYITNNYTTVFISTGLLLLLVAVALGLSKLLTKEPYEQRVFRYCITLANYSYMGYALVEDIDGGRVLTNLILFCIPFAIYTYSFGYMLLTESDKSFKKLFNPITCAIFIGAVVGLVALPIPDVVGKIVTSSSACVGPLAMLITGITLSQFSFKELVANKTAYIVCALRLVVLPLAVFGLFKLLGFTTLLPYAVLMASMPTGLNTIVFPKLVGKDCKPGARLAFLSHLFSCITLPIWLSIIQF